MNPSRPARCLFCRIQTRTKRPLIGLRNFHPSSSRPARRKPTFRNVKAEDLGLIKTTGEDFPRYTADELAQLKEKYTEEQLKALEAGEEAIDSEDLAAQGTIRDDPFRFKYLDDFSKIRPGIDKPIRNPEGNYDPDLRYKTEDEIFGDLAEFYQNTPDNMTEGQARLAFRRFEDENRWTVGKEEAERAPRDYLAPDLPEFEDPTIRYPEKVEGVTDPAMLPVLQQTGFTPDDLKKFRSKHLVMHRVVNQTRMGKIMTQYSLTIAGDGQGLLGIGEGKAGEPEDARRQSLRSAIRNMQPIHRYEGRTIFGDVQAKVGASVVSLMHRPPGFGVRCQQYIFEMCRCAGITDLAARVTRSRNPMNVVKATFEALRKQKLPEEIARARGRKLVDVRKVYYGDQV
ncbi:MAG: 28S ribosomal protein S5, mitochondrial [Peltula sp. TS41687]|nr:MAG: 28S ribosomal protein S5, mitochondrial [Peltula sp. TS41687]